jgi:uncharacterized protein (DUF697 family)
MAKSKKSKPSFDTSGDPHPAPATSWVYRTDATEPKTTPAAPRAKKKAAATTDTVAPPAPTTAPPPTTTAPGTLSDRATAAQRIVDRYARYSATAGLVPIPLVDVATIAAVQVTMLTRLAAHYNLPFSRERGKAVVSALLGGLMPALAGHQLLKLVGTVAGMVSVSGFAFATTSAVGRVFIAHFEAGGTLLDIDIEQARQRVAGQLSRAASPASRTDSRP